MPTTRSKLIAVTALTAAVFALPGIARAEAVPVAPIITTPTNGMTFRSPNNVIVAGTSEAGVTITISEGSTTLGSTLANSGGNWTKTFTAQEAQTLFTEGTHTVTAIATKDGLDSPPSAPVTFSVDLTSPAAPTIVEPAELALRATRILVTGAGEPGTTVEIREAASLIGATGVHSDGRWALELVFSEGDHSLRVNAIDAAGNVGPSSPPRNFTVDAAPPAIAITEPVGPTIFSMGAPAVVKGTATDNRGVARVEIRYFDLIGREVISARAATCLACPLGTSVTWSDAPILPPGVYTVRAQAVDRVENRSPFVTTSFILLP